MTQPAFVGGHLLLYAAAKGGLRLVALDPKTGVTAWSVAASPAAAAPDQFPAVAVVGTDVIAFRATSGQIAEIVARDASSGKEIWHSRPGFFTTWPDVCPADPNALCLTGTYQPRRQSGELLEFNERTGAQLRSIVLPSSTPAARALGSGLFDPGVRDPELLVAAPGPRVIWERPLASIFTTPGASTDNGWDFSPVVPGAIFVGWVGAGALRHTTSTTVFDLARTATVGFRAADGSTVWRSAGTTYVCGVLPCPGEWQRGFSGPGDLAPPIVGLRLREIGTATYVAGSSVPKLSPNARVALEGFDLASGRTLWTFSAGRDTSIATANPPRLNNGRLVLPSGSGGLIALDPLTGDRNQVPQNAQAWCRSLILYTERVPYLTGTSRIHQYAGQYTLFPCTADQHRRALNGSPPAFVSMIGARGDGLVAWSDTDRVVATPGG